MIQQQNSFLLDLIQTPFFTLYDIVFERRDAICFIQDKWRYISSLNFIFFHTHVGVKQKFTAINSLQSKCIQKVNAKKQGVYQYTPQHDFRVCEREERMWQEDDQKFSRWLNMYYHQ